MTSGDDATPTIKSALRVMLLVELLTEQPQGMTFPEIREALDVPKSSLHGLLRVMTSRGHLVFDPATRLYRLGVRYWEAGQAFMHGADLSRVAQPYLEAVRDALNETVQLSILDGLENVYIAKVEADQVLQLVSKVGSRLPAHTTGLGKVLLAYQDPAKLEELLTGVVLEKFTENTVADQPTLMEVLKEVRASGYATDDGEYTPGVFCVAVPVFGHDGQVTAAMSCSVPSIRIGASTKADMLQALNEQAQALSAALGYRE
ncbi:IclR family transcriptional regulator [Jiangella sp. DSM 45060]|uniref:IclR family transcriptional regulator n=1 Tax=Jiangella sp. DSM 45060 TaxID=1798224 RepID=UPI00087989CD|nr:IclR family transcriptional regulator [Jiangella sp. DSM 45060]SDT46295.1 DNA-binding transcriptional regulator, IclR family [Jiangella sp. DSM 45060]